MNQIPKISIIVPIYNVEKYLPRCIASLLEQTLSDIEIILVDDESPDNCPQLCNDYAKKDNRIKVIHKKNEGLGYARNSGLDIAKGEYVMFVDSDDTIEKDSCSHLYNIAKVYDADIVCGNFNKEVFPGKWIKTEQKEGIQILKGDEVNKYMLDMIASAPYCKTERLHPVSVCVTCIKRALIEKLELRFKSEREVASEDTIFKATLLKNTKTLVRLPYAFYRYYINDTSLTHSFDIKKFFKLKILYFELSKLFNNNKEAKLRIERFIISDARMHFLRLVNSNNKNKIELMTIMMNDDLWKYVKEYKPSFYPFYQRIFYMLIILKKPLLLYAFAKSVNLLKHIRK